MINSTIKESNISYSKISYKIDDLFHESSYRLFRNYCRRNHKVYLKELENFDFDSLYDEKGFGKAKVKSIISRWEEWEKSGVKSGIVKSRFQKETKIAPYYFNTDVAALKALSVDNKIIEWLQKNHVRTLGDISSIDLSDINSIPNIGAAKCRRFIDGLSLLNINVDELYKKILHIIKEDEHFYLFKRRAVNKETLQYIADSRNISRERVRQLEMRIHQRMKGYFIMFSPYIIDKVGGGKVFDGDKLDSVYENIEDRLIVKYALKSGDSEKITYFNEINKYLVDTDMDKLKAALNSMIMESVPDVFNYYEGMYSIEEMLLESDVGFIEYEDFIAYIMKHGYRRYKDYIWKGSMKLSKCYSIIVKEYFKDGIKLSDEESINFVRKVFKDKFGREDACENNRAIAARIESDNVLCGRGKYISPDYINIPMDLLLKIKDYINSSSQDNIFIADIYRVFEDELKKSSNIDNRYFLHGILKYYYGDEFIFTKDNVVKDGRGKFSSHERFERFLLSKRRPVSKAEIRSIYQGWTDSMFNNAVALNKNILYWDNGYFINAMCLDLKEKWVANLKKIIESSLKKNNGYTNANIVYLEALKKMDDFITANSIKNSFNIYSILEYCFGGIYYFRRPHILKERPNKQFTTLDLFYKLVEEKNIINYADFCEYFKKMCFTERTIYNAFHKVCSELIQIDADKYVLKSAFTLGEEEKRLIGDEIEKTFGKSPYLPLRKIQNFSRYPDIGYEWNSYILESIIENYIGGYRIIEKYFKDRRYKCPILVRQNSDIQNITDLIIYVIKNEYKEEMTLGRIQEYLQKKKIILKVLPKEIWESDMIMVDSNDRLKIVK